MAEEDLISHVSVNLLPGENAISMVSEALQAEEFYHTSSINYPLFSATAPMIRPPAGYDASDCIFVEFIPSWPMSVVISKDTVTGYAAIFNAQMRLRRCQIASTYIMELCSRMGSSLRLHCLSKGEVIHSRVNAVRLFAFQVLHQMNLLADFYKNCCTIPDWRNILEALNDGDQSRLPTSLFDLLELHRKYIYLAASRIVSLCQHPSLRVEIENLLRIILEHRLYIEGAVRRFGSLENALMDLDTWSHISVVMADYKRHISAIQEYKHHIAGISEDERMLTKFIELL